MSKLNHPKIEKAWRAFIDETKKHYPNPLDQEDYEAIERLDLLIDPLISLDDDEGIGPGTWTPSKSTEIP